MINYLWSTYISTKFNTILKKTPCIIIYRCQIKSYLNKIPTHLKILYIPI